MDKFFGVKFENILDTLKLCFLDILGLDIYFGKIRDGYVLRFIYECVYFNILKYIINNN